MKGRCIDALLHCWLEDDVGYFHLFTNPSPTDGKWINFDDFVDTVCANDGAISFQLLTPFSSSCKGSVLIIPQ